MSEIVEKSKKIRSPRREHIYVSAQKRHEVTERKKAKHQELLREEIKFHLTVSQIVKTL